MLIKNLFLVLSLFAISIQGSSAQSILGKSAQTIMQLENATYDVFYDGQLLEQISKDTIHSSVRIMPSDKYKGSHYSINITGGYPMAYHYDGENELVLFRKDSTYNIRVPSENQYTRSLITHWAQQFEKWQLEPEKLIQQADTLINEKQYSLYNYIGQKDSIINGHLTYSLKTIIIDKTSFLPYKIIDDSKFLFNDLLTQAKFIYIYDNYALNESEFPDLSEFVIPSNYLSDAEKGKAFEKQKEDFPTLTAGTIAPSFGFTDINGIKVDSVSLSNKLILLNFTSTLCPYAIESIGGLKRIRERFKPEELEIINIYAELNAEELVTGLIKKYNIQEMTTVLNGSFLFKKFRAYGSPNFFIIDKNNMISFAKAGYTKGIEESMVNEILRQSAIR